MFVEPSRSFVLSLFSLALVFSSCASTEDTPVTPPPSKEVRETIEAPARGDQVQDQQGVQRGREELQTLEAQRHNLLIEERVRAARNLMSQGRLEEAETELLAAKDIDPDRAEVVTMLNQVQSQLGRRPGEVGTFADQMTRLAEIRQQRARSDAMQRIDSAKRSIEAGDYNTAIQELRLVLLQVESGPQIAWGEIEQEARALLKRAETERDQREGAEREAAERDAFNRLQREEQLRQARLRDEVTNLMNHAVRHFESQRYLEAREHADRVLRIDSNNDQAQHLHSLAEKALRDSRRDAYFRSAAQDMKRWKEANQEVRIPYTDILTPPDSEQWARLDEIRKQGRPVGAAPALDDASRAVQEQLATTRVARLSYTEENGAFDQVVRDLQTITNVPILITPGAREAITGDNVKVILTLDAPITAKNFLDIITTRFSDKLGYYVKDGAVFIATKQEALGQPVVQTHDIHDLTFGITNFAGPRIKEIPVQGQTQSGPDADVPRSGGVVGEQFKFVDPEQLVQAIKESVDKGTWDTEGFKVEAIHGNMLVIHTPETQARVAQFLDDLRRFHSSVVTIDSKFLSVSQNWIQQIGVDIRGLGGPGQQGDVAQLDDLTNGLDDNSSRGLDNAGTGDAAGHPSSGLFFNDGGDGDLRARTENFFTNPLGRLLSTTGGATVGISILDDSQLNLILRAVEKSSDIQVMNSQILTVMNTQRANISVITLTSYIQDFAVEVAQASFIADPQVDVLQDGVVLDVRPVISYDRRYITLDLQPTVAELSRPIPTFTTSLAGSTLPVTLQLPNMHVRSAATTVTVPDGGSVLIGGLREILNRERRAEVPWLARLPLVSIFFKEEGSVDENTSLMVLVRAQITDVKDYMATRTASATR